MAKKKVEVPTHLTAQDQRGIELSLHEAKVHKMNMQLCHKDTEILKIKKELIEAQIQLAQQQQGNLGLVYKQKAQEHTKFMNELKLRYGAGEADQFGFDPISGEVKITTKG